MSVKINFFKNFKRKRSMEKEGKLLQTLNLFDATLLVVGAVLGSGIFLTTGDLALFLPSPGWILISWVLGGLIILAGALSFAELGVSLPYAGGQYIYLREAYGRFLSFLYGWTFFFVIQCGGVAAISAGFSEYLGYFFPTFSTQREIFTMRILGFEYTLFNGQIVAVLSILLLTFLNYFGLKIGSRVQNFFTLIKLMAILVFVFVGFTFGKGGGLSFKDFFSISNFEKGLFSALGTSLFAIYWAYDGWYSVNCTASEIKNGRKNIPLSLSLGILILIFTYTLINLLYIFSLPLNKIAGVRRIAEASAFSLFGSDGAKIVSAVITISIFGCLSATVIYGPRVFYAMAKDGLFFRSLSRIHPKYNSPSNAVVAQGIWSSILALSGKFRALYEYVIFALILFFIFSGVSVFVLRLKHPEWERPYRVWGYPIVPIVFIAFNLCLFLISLQNRFSQFLPGILIISSGVPFYFILQRMKRGS